MQVFAVISLYDVPLDDHLGTKQTRVDLHEIFQDNSVALAFVENAPKTGARPGAAWERKFFIVPKEVK